MPASYLKQRKGKMKNSQSGFKESSRWDHSFAILLCSIIVMGPECILDLSDKLLNIYILEGLALDRIQTVVRCKNYSNFDDIAEIALV